MMVHASELVTRVDHDVPCEKNCDQQPVANSNTRVRGPGMLPCPCLAFQGAQQGTDTYRSRCENSRAVKRQIRRTFNLGETLVVYGGLWWSMVVSGPETLTSMPKGKLSASCRSSLTTAGMSGFNRLCNMLSAKYKRKLNMLVFQLQKENKLIKLNTSQHNVRMSNLEFVWPQMTRLWTFFAKPAFSWTFLILPGNSTPRSKNCFQHRKLSALRSLAQAHCLSWEWQTWRLYEKTKKFT